MNSILALTGILVSVGVNICLVFQYCNIPDPDLYLKLSEDFICQDEMHLRAVAQEDVD